MRKFLVPITAALVLTATAATVSAGDEKGGLRYSITVTKFENKAGWSGQWDIGDAWGTVFTDLLNQSGKFIVLGETDMRSAAMEEQDLGASGRTAGGNKTAETGQMTPAQLLVKGAITHVQDSTSGGSGGVRVKGLKLGGSKDEAQINVTIYIVDATTGQVLASKSVVGSSKRKGLGVGYSGANFGAGVDAFKKDNTGKAVEAACAEGVEFLIAQLPNLPWTGSVVMVKGDKVYVNRGSREGVTSGQTFVVGEVTVIRDPDSGEILDRDMKELARLTASEVKEKLTICTVASGSAAAIKKGMEIHTP